VTGTGPDDSAVRGPRQQRVQVNSRFSDLLKGAVMELSNYELVRYPSGQLIITRSDAKSSFRDVVGVYTSEAEAQRALERLTNPTIAAEQVAQTAAALPRVA
jgi:hypothetical protein